MVFSSVTFLFLFLPITLLLTYLFPKKFSNFILLLASLFFYAWGEPIYIVLMLVSSLVNYLMAYVIKRKGMLVINILFNLGLLGFFKYAGFFVDLVNQLIGTHLQIIEIALPIGISFYTFQTMSYVIDVYRGKAEVQKSYLNLLLYISFFPQLIAGPIVRYTDIEKQLQNRTISRDNFIDGVKQFVIGLGKKVLLANQMAVLVDYLYPQTNLSMFGSWLMAISYVFQIYFDFSGYSDMAIGLGEMLGFHFKENFDKPLASESIQDFWRRWHISLSTWFKEYLYIPLGGNRKGKRRTILNQLFVFFCTGLWHGASYNYIIWGILQWVLISIEKYILKVEKWPKILKHIYTFVAVTLSFLVFRSENLRQGLSHFKAMFSFAKMDSAAWINLQTVLNPLFVFIFIVCILIAANLFRKLKLSKNTSAIFCLIIWLACVLTLSASTYNPFIYFRF